MKHKTKMLAHFEPTRHQRKGSKTLTDSVRTGGQSTVRRRFTICAAMTLATIFLFEGGTDSRALAAEAECIRDDGTQSPCNDEKGERLAVYVAGREAYENARITGDFSEALALSRQLVSKGDKNGERLLKMIYLQLGWGAHRDYVQAYVWLSEGGAGGGDYLDLWRKKLMEKMTPEQIAAAQKLAGK